MTDLATPAGEVRPLRLGLLGLGFSHPHAFARLFRDNALEPAAGRPDTWRQAAVTHIWDDDPAAARAFADEFGSNAVTSPDDIPTDDVDGVLIETRNGERARYALPFLRAGIPTFIDKPICTTPDDLRLILDTAREHRTPLFSTSSARYHPAVPALRRLIDGGELGTLLAVRATTSHTIKRYLEEPHTWQDDIQMGGGTIVNMGIHGMEPLVTLLGPGLESVACQTEKRYFTASRSEDTALITLRWATGVLATLEVYSGSAVGGQRFTACGSAGVVEAAVNELSWWGGKTPPARLPASRGYVPMLEAFCDMVRTREQPVSLAETEAVALGLFAARRAAAEGRTVSLFELR
ncbi:MAG: Gfo/Idh/MocA family oxidoreductase [Chloroflexi bacterium]|nr:Gfo/Idh/MocA family oxidoreductase [Chloroflexota bacterium]